jgi:uncharacterized membrane protein
MNSRLAYLDWLRGVAVMIMITWHLLDSWTLVEDRAHPAFQALAYSAGTFTALFLFLAGVAVALSAGSKLRRFGSASPAAAMVVRRGLEIFAVAFLIRFQSIVLSNAPWRSLLRVDILNIMGLAVIATAIVWALPRTARGRLVALAAVTLGIAFATPIVRELGWLAALPDPIEGYIRPVQPFSSFVLFPWAGFVFAGGVVGLIVDASRQGFGQARLNRWFLVAGAALAAAAFAASYLPSPYARSSFWTSSPAYFFLRLGILLVAVAAAYAWSARPGGDTAWSPVRQLGATSLFIYWIHIEMVYGRMSAPLHRALPFGQALLALATFALFMLALSMAKTWVAARLGWAGTRHGGPAPQPHA